MATIKIKNSQVKDKAPQPSDLVDGELAINTHADSPAVYLKDTAGAVRKIAGVGAVGATAATDTAAGVVELATAAEVTTGTDTTRAVTPAGLKVELDKKAPLASPALTGTPTAPTAAAGTNTTQLATTEFVTTAVAAENLWDRTGTVVSPANAGDQVHTATGKLTVGGTAAAPAVSLDPGTTGSPLVRDSSGRVGINTTSPEATLHSRADNAGSGSTPLLIQNRSISANTAVGISFAPNVSDTADRSAIIYGVNSSGGSGNATDLAFHTNANGGAPSEKARIDSSGRLLVGTSSARNNFLGSNSAAFQVEGNLGVGSAGQMISHVYGELNALGGPYLVLGKHRSGSIGGTTLVANNDQLGAVAFTGADGTSFLVGAQIQAFVDGTPGANNMPGRLVFSTTPSGAAAPVERMRIKSDGAIAVGTPETAWFSEAQKVVFRQGSAGACQLNIHDLANHYPFEAWNSAESGTRGLIRFRSNGTGVVVGGITTDGTSTTYATSSDYRLKENVTPVTDGIARLQQLKPSRFNFIAAPGCTVDGFIAHEVQAVVPEAITGEKDAVDEDGNPIYQGIDQSKLVPLLTAALQEAIGEIESLKARVAALESA